MSAEKSKQVAMVMGEEAVKLITNLSFSISFGFIHRMRLDILIRIDLDSRFNAAVVDLVERVVQIVLVHAKTPPPLEEMLDAIQKLHEENPERER